MAKNFALIGAAGYIAERHMRAIKDTKNSLTVALDKSDSVGVIDRYFPSADFFVEYERFDRHVEKLKRLGSDSAIDYVSICSPNYLHDSHIRFALRAGAHAICEKPLVLNPWNVEALADSESQFGKKVNTILQLRLHPSIIELKKKIESNPNKVYDVDLTYITSRGSWYLISWKGQLEKSGGVATNIGIHFFDMLIWVFGGVKNSILHQRDDKMSAGFLELEKANVRWFLSIDKNNLPGKALSEGKTTYRSITCDGKEVEFSGGFEDLHTKSYEKILSGEGYGLADSLPSIQIAYDIRNASLSSLSGDYHPFCQK